MKSLHPLLSFPYFVAVLALTMLIRNPVATLGSLLGAFCYWLMTTNGKEKRADLGFYLPLAVLITVANPVFSHNGKTPLFFLNDNAFTLESLLYGAFNAALIVSVLLWSKAYSKTVTSDKFLYLFGGILPKTALILSVALRYLPMLRKEARRLKDAQKTVGLYSKGSVTDNFLSSCKIYYALIGRTLENAVGTAESMRARGWGKAKRVPFARYRFHTPDKVLAPVLLFLFVVVAVGAGTGSLTFSFYPAPTNPLPNGFSAFAAAAFWLLSFFPALYETEVNLQWRLLQSKISASAIPQPTKTR